MDSSSWALSLVSIYSWVAVIFVLFVNSFLRRVAYFTRCAKVAGPPAQIPLFGSITDLPGNAGNIKKKNIYHYCSFNILFNHYFMQIC